MCQDIHHGISCKCRSFKGYLREWHNQQWNNHAKEYYITIQKNVGFLFVLTRNTLQRTLVREKTKVLKMSIFLCEHTKNLYMCIYVYVYAYTRIYTYTCTHKYIYLNQPVMYLNQPLETSRHLGKTALQSHMRNKVGIYNTCN